MREAEWLVSIDAEAMLRCLADQLAIGVSDECEIGNCGVPLETEAGWLLLTHGVGPMRSYCIGAALLDLDNPCRVIGQTSQPLLVGDKHRRY